MGTARVERTEGVVTPSSQEVETIVRSLFEAFNRRDFAVATQVVAEECEFTDVPSGMVFRGPAGFVDFEEGWLTAFPDGQIEIINLVCRGDTCITEYRGRGTHDGPLPGPDGRTIAPTGKKVQLGLIDVAQYKGGKMVRGRCYYDALSLARQLGVG